ncbi:MAG: hypothetical protein PHU85_15460, partial [Phycisphaerae bacterium]|nr:hypothetical protein [Phycisphaerae bacterium]
RLGLERTVEILARESGAEVLRLMPAIRVFKIGVQFDMSGGEDDGAKKDDGETGRGGEGETREHDAGTLERGDAEPPFSRRTEGPRVEAPLTAADIAVVRVLQEDMPLSPRPFDESAPRAGLSVEQLLAAAAQMQQAGRLRRLAALLHHRAAGFAANAMGVWVAPPDRVEEIGLQMAMFKTVSHCYQRPTWPDWPFNLFTMIHGHTPADCEAALAEIRESTGLDTMSILYSLEEYKKIRLRYFTGEIEAWEQQHAGG